MKKAIRLSHNILIASSVVMILLLPACKATSPVIKKVDTAKQNSFFELFDSNRDQIVTMNEFNSSGPSRFKKDDLDNNGMLSRKEYLEASKARMEIRKEKKRLERRNKRFTETDINQNGSISEKEYLATGQARALKTFVSMDADENGIISTAEYNSYRYMSHSNTMERKTSPYQMFKNIDSNKDNQISMAERNTARLKWFDGMDKNGDAVITLMEYKQARSERNKTEKNKVK